MAKKAMKELLSWGVAIGSALLVALLLVTFVFQFTIVVGESMQPTLGSHDVLFVDKVTYALSSPHRGDIVVCKYPVLLGDGEHASSDNYIKRVIGLPGETVEIRDNIVYIDGHPELDRWMGSHRLYDMPPQLVQAEHYFVMGDNRSNSLDSEDDQVGQLPKSFIKGRARLTLFPFRNFGVIR